MLEAQVPAICEDEVPWRRVDSMPVQWAVPEYSGVVHRPQPAHIRVRKAALMVTNCLQDDGREQFLVLEFNFHWRCARRKPLLSKKNMKARLKCVRENVDKDQDFWNSDIWTDEPKTNYMDTRTEECLA